MSVDTYSDVSPAPLIGAMATATSRRLVMSERALARFWAKVDKNGPVGSRRPHLGPCWMWTGSCYTEKGRRAYGQIMVDGVRTSTHRLSFLVHVGPIPAGKEVMHLCDTKPCVRPDHLRAGTRTENLLDGFAAPRNQGVCAGENNGRARLTWDHVHAIRASRDNQPTLAARYGVTQSQISQILAGKKWPESKCPVHGTASSEVAA